MKTSRVRGAGLGAMTVAGVGALLFVVAPNAMAIGNQVAVEGSNPQAGCSYKVTSGDVVGGGSASVNGMKVTFYDNGALIGTGTVGGGILGNPAKASWSPKTAGEHVLSATGDLFGTPYSFTSLTVQVKASSGTGSFGCPLPSISAS